MGSRLFFTSAGTDGRSSLWVTDGTETGTAPVPAINARLAGLAAVHFASLNGQPFFEGVDAAGQANLFTVDAASGVATELSVPAGNSAGLSPTGLFAFNNRLYFQARGLNGAFGLFSSDGTGFGTVLLTPGSFGSFYASNFTRFGTMLAFSGSLATGNSGLYLTDGTAAGTRQVAVLGAPAAGISIRSMAAVGDRLVFVGITPTIKEGLWVSDGTTLGTVQLAIPGLGVAGDYVPAGLISFGTKAAFTATDASGKAGFWITDGTAAGTTELQGVVADTHGAPMAALPGGRLAFIGSDAAGLKGVYITDGITVTAVQPSAAAPGGLAPNALLVLGTRLLFDGNTPGGVRSLFQSDGTSAGTTVLQSGIGLVAGTIDTDSALVGPMPSVAAANAPTLTSNAAAVIGTAAAGTDGDRLSVTLLADPGFAAGGSSIALNAQNQVVYTAGAVTTANAGADTVQYRITDVITGQTVDASESLLLSAPAVAAPAGPALGYANATTGQSGTLVLDAAAAGGPSYLLNQYIYAGSDDLALSTQAPNVFIHSGAGNDAIQVSSGQNVLDGGLGSNFLTGGSGTDTFFTDARASGVVWNTIRNIHAGDAATLWGFTAGISSYRWETAVAGAAGSEGATLRANIVGGNGRTGDGIDASITFTGLSVAQAKNLQIVTGSVAAGNYLYIYDPGV